MDIKTPAYIFDINTVVNRIKFIKSKLPNIRLSYAMKANPYLVEFLIDYVDSFEVCSPGEYQICKSVNVPKDKIVLSGVFKDPQDIENIVKECGDKPVYTIESIHQCELLNRIAKQNDLTLKVFLRLSSGNQFGMDEDTIKNISTYAYQEKMSHSDIRELIEQLLSKASLEIAKNPKEYEELIIAPDIIKSSSSYSLVKRKTS